MELKIISRWEVFREFLLKEVLNFNCLGRSAATAIALGVELKGLFIPIHRLRPVAIEFHVFIIMLFFNALQIFFAC